MNKLSWLQKNLIVSIPFTMVLGLVYGYISEVDYLKRLIIPLTFLMVLPMMINLPIRKIFSGGDSKVQVVTQLINFAVTPFVAFYIGSVFFPENDYIVLGILLTGLLPTSGMTISWTGMAKGNMPAAIKMTVFGLLIGSFATPIYIEQLMGAQVEVNMMKIVQQILIIIVLPLILGHLIQRSLIAYYGMSHYQEKLKNKFPPISTLGVLGIVFVAMALKSKTILSMPMVLVQILVPLVLLYSFNLILSTLIGKFFFNRGDAIALLYGSVMRNLSIALAIAMTAFGEEGSDIALVISLGYIIQVQMGAWVVKFTDRIYGAIDAPKVQDFIHTGVFSLHLTNSLEDASRLLSEEKIHSLAVLNDEEKPVGTLGLKQLIRLLASKVPLQTPLSDIALSKAVLVDISQPLNDVINEMQHSHDYKVIVTNKSGDIEGIISGFDILDTFSETKKAVKEPVT